MTEKHEIFPHPPIKEAVIDVRLDEGSQYTKELLKGLSNQAPEGYSPFEEMHRSIMDLHFVSGEFQTRHTKTFQGYQAANESRGFLAQFQFEGFSMIKQASYAGWDDLKSEAKKLWALYKAAKPELKIARISIRYINQIQLPGGLEFEDYLCQSPSTPATMPDVVGGFLTRIEVPYEDLGVTAAITTLLDTWDQDNLNVILDIDVLKTRNLELTDDALWDTFDSLQEIKNDAFFGSITEKTKELFR